MLEKRKKAIIALQAAARFWRDKRKAKVLRAEEFVRVRFEQALICQVRHGDDECDCDALFRLLTCFVHLRNGSGCHSQISCIPESHYTPCSRSRGNFDSETLANA